MGSPVHIAFRDGTWRCDDCKGFGLVRAAGARAGSHYKTLNGAQTAYVNGNARDCPICEGSGLCGDLGVVGQLQSYGIDREEVNGEKVRLGVRGPLLSSPGYEAHYLDRARTRGVPDFSSPVF